MFRRQIELIGEQNQKLLAQKKILIVGCGGLGNSIATILSCIGLKKIVLVDYDEVEIHNIHRQFQFSKKNIGEKKAEVLARKISRCNSEIECLVGYFDERFNIDVDLVFDATDNFETRQQIDKFAKSKNIPWIYASVDEYVGQAGVFKKTSFDIFATKKLSTKGQIPPMISLISSIAAMLGLKTLLNQQDEILYFVDFNKDLEIKKFYF